jgi:hypothetical protein
MATVTNSVVEAAAAARLASERAKQTSTLSNINEVLSEWEKAIQLMQDDNSAELSLKTGLAVKLDGLQAIVSTIEGAPEEQPDLSSTNRYDLLICLAGIHETWYQGFKGDSDALIHAIRCWEEAYGLSVTLHRMKEAVRFFTTSHLHFFVF